MSTQSDFVRRLDDAISDYMARATAKEVQARYGISVSTLHRHMRLRGLQLSAEEISRRRSESAQLSTRRGNTSEKCKRPCSCGKHKKNAHNLKHPIIMGRKNCGECGRWKSILDFHVRERFPDGEPAAFQTNCKVCQAARSRYNQGMKRRGKPYGVRRPKMTPDEAKAHKRKLYHWKKANLPGWFEDRREYARFYAEGQRRKAGIEPRKFKRMERGHNPKNEPKLPLEPFQQWVRDRSRFYAMREGLFESAQKGTTPGIAYLAQVCGVADRTLRRYLDGYEILKSGERRDLDGVPFSTLDQCLTYEGSTFLWELYPGVDDEQLLAA